MADDGQARLESWKEIGAYLQRDVRTARRWELEEGLPVHRHTHNSRSTVYAYPSEIDSWRASRKVVPEPEPPVGLWKSLMVPPQSLAVGVTLALCLVMVGNGLRPQAASAQGTAPSARQVWADSRNQPDSVSADGRYVSFTDWDTGDLAIRDMRAGTNRRLTNTGGWQVSGDYTEGTAISPDGSQIAYHWFIDKEHRDEFRIIPVNGGTPRSFPQGKQREQYVQPYGWTPDGKEVLVARSVADHTTQIAMLAAKDGSVRVLKSFLWANVKLSLSPDGRYVAYAVPPEEKTPARDIFVLATDGSTDVAVVKHQAEDHDPVWSGDGSRLLFLSNRTGSDSLWAVSIEKGQAKGSPELIRAGFGGVPLGVTRSGTLYYDIFSPTQNVYFAELEADGKAKAPVLASETFQNHNVGPDVSADGRFLVFESNRQGGHLPDITGRVIVIRTLQTGEERVIPLPLLTRAIFIGPRWFPDGRSILLYGQEPGSRSSGFYRLDVATGKYTLLRRDVAPIQGVALSPDGKTMFYSEDTGEHGTRIVRMDLDTGRESELLRGATFTRLAVSPDNRQLAYVTLGSTKGGTWVRIMPAGGGASREIFRSSDRIRTFTWSPDQRFVVFSSGHSLWRVPASGGVAERMLTMNGSFRNTQVHPDGSKLVFDLNETAHEFWLLENFLPEARK